MLNQFFVPNVADSQGYATPYAGGVINARAWSFAYNTSGIATGATLFTLPLNAVIVGITLNITTAFDGTGTNTLSFGTTGALTQYAASVDASVTGQTSTGWTASQLFTKLATDVPITVRYNGT
jgi:hypothetical protein